MQQSKADRLTGALQSFLGSSPDVEAVAIVSFDGLVMAAALPDELEEDRIGAMSAALLGLGEQAVRGLGCGQLNQLFVEGDEGFVFLMSARDQAVLAAVTSRAAKVGFVLFEMRRAAEAVGLLLEHDEVASVPVGGYGPVTPASAPAAPAVASTVAPVPHGAPVAAIAPLPDAPFAPTAVGTPLFAPAAATAVLPTNGTTPGGHGSEAPGPGSIWG